MVDFATVAQVADIAARALALGLVVVTGAVAATHWAVRNKRLAPFGAWSRTVRRLSDPALRPIERRMLRAGANPQDATYWMFGLAIALGLLLITAVRWVFGFVYSVIALSQASPAIWARTILDWIFGLLVAALFVRVVAGWLGISTYRPWMRPVYWLTEWLLKPIRQRLPPLGMIDLSPLIAYVVLMLLRLFLVGVLFR